MRHAFTIISAVYDAALHVLEISVPIVADRNSNYETKEQSGEIK